MLLQKYILLALTVATLSGCASIVTDTTHPVTINSLPNKADFVVTNLQGKTVQSGKTPATITLKPSSEYFKGEKYTLKFQKDGYGTQSAPLNAELNNWYWGNLLFGWGVGMFIVDPLTGAMWTLPQSKSVVLVPSQ